MAASQESIDELHDKCGLSKEDCRAALDAHGEKVDAALGALIDSGKVKVGDLNPETVSDELFEQAARKQKLDMYRKTSSFEGGLAGMMLKTLGQDDKLAGVLKEAASKIQELKRAKYGDKTPEEMMAEDDARKAERMKELYASNPAFAGKKPLTPGEQARSASRTKRRSEWLKANPFTLNLAPFPPLKREMHEWTGTDIMPAWAGLQARQGGYTSVSSDEPSDGSFKLNVPRIGSDDVNPAPPAPQQVAAYAYLKEHQEEVTQAVLEALFKEFKHLMKLWAGQDIDDLPTIESVEQMKDNVGIGTLHMFEVYQGDLAYYGLELGCTWDEEHGTGVVLHGGRVVAAGSADVSFDRHEAMKDGGIELGGQ